MKRRLCPICNSPTETARHFNAAIRCPKCGYVVREEGESCSITMEYSEDVNLGQLAARKLVLNTINNEPLDEHALKNPKSRELNMQLNAYIVYCIRKLEAIRKLEEQ